MFNLIFPLQTKKKKKFTSDNMDEGACIFAQRRPAMCKDFLLINIINRQWYIPKFWVWFNFSIWHSKLLFSFQKIVNVSNSFFCNFTVKILVYRIKFVTIVK